MTEPIPAGFKAIEHTGPFLGLNGPLYFKKADGKLVLGIRIEERHTNMRGIVHGGMLVAIADSALGTVLYNTRQPPQPMVTVSLTTDFIESAYPGDWVEAHVDVLRIGSRLAYANCHLHVGERRILRASAVFAVVPEIKPKEESEG
jgi:uncharacterized protein (TIGR00369 family)